MSFPWIPEPLLARSTDKVKRLTLSHTGEGVTVKDQVPISVCLQGSGSVCVCLFVIVRELRKRACLSSPFSCRLLSVLRPARPFRIATASEDNSVGFFEGPPFKFKHTNQEHSRFATAVKVKDEAKSF